TITQIVAREYVTMDNSNSNPILKIDTISISRVERTRWVLLLDELKNLDKSLESTKLSTSTNVKNNNQSTSGAHSSKSTSINSVATQKVKNKSTGKQDLVVFAGASSALNDPALNSQQQMV